MVNHGLEESIVNWATDKRLILTDKMQSEYQTITDTASDLFGSYHQKTG